MALNCVLHVSHREDVICLMAVIRALAAWPSISRGNCLKKLDLNPFSVPTWLKADPLRCCMPQALDNKN